MRAQSTPKARPLHIFITHTIIMHIIPIMGTRIMATPTFITLGALITADMAVFQLADRFEAVGHAPEGKGPQAEDLVLAADKAVSLPREDRERVGAEASGDVQTLSVTRFHLALDQPAFRDAAIFGSGLSDLVRARNRKSRPSTAR